MEQKFYTIKDLMQIIGVSHNTAYKLVKLKGFPKIKIGSKILIDKDGFDKWIKENMNSEIAI